MLLFLFIAFNLGLLALAAGVLLLVWSFRNHDVGSTTARIAGIIISVLALAGVCYLGSNMIRALTEQQVPPPPMQQPMQPPMPKPETEKHEKS